MRGVVFAEHLAESGGSEYGWYHVLSEEDGLCDLRSLRPFASSWADSLAKAAVYTERVHEYRCLRPKNQKALNMGKGKGAAVGPFYRVKPGWPLFRFIAENRVEAQSLCAVARSKLG